MRAIASKPFVLAHNLLLDLSWGISLPSLPEKVADRLTLLVILGGGFFLCRRLGLKRVRSISGVQDFLMLFIATVPFVTGYLAYHQIFDYKTMAILKKKGRVTYEELLEIKEIVWKRCVLCMRCYCPLGIDIPRMIALARQMCRCADVVHTWDEPWGGEGPHPLPHEQG
jgi:hypothetical protein